MMFPRNFLVVIFLAGTLYSAPVPVRFVQGSAHGFLVLKTTQGIRLATGDVTQTVHGDQVTSHLSFQFKDHSVYDETTVFSQKGTFRLISDHLVQHGRSFPKSLDFLIESSGWVSTVTDGGKVTREHLDLPPDVSNGLPPNLLMNILPSAPGAISFVAPGAKPRLVQVVIKTAGKKPFIVGDTRREAIDYILHVELGGLTGVIAPIIGKQPADYHIWILLGNAPAFIREEGQLFEGGPIWRIEQVSPAFAH